VADGGAERRRALAPGVPALHLSVPLTVLSGMVQADVGDAVGAAVGDRDEDPGVTPGAGHGLRWAIFGDGHGCDANAVPPTEPKTASSAVGSDRPCRGTVGACR